MEATAERSVQAGGANSIAANVDVPHYAVLRCAGVSTAIFSRLALGQTVRNVDRLLDLRARCLELRESSCTALERLIGIVQNAQSKAELILLRRDIYNDRPPRKELSPEVQRAVKLLQVGEQQGLGHWLASRAEREQLLRQAEIEYSRELAAGRAVLRRLFSNRQFRRGLALASPILSCELNQYISAADVAQVPRIRRTERSLIRYYTRAAFKLTPFSTFTQTILVRDGRRKTERSRPRTTVKLNRAFVMQLAEWLAIHPDISDHVPVANTTSSSLADEAVLLLRRRVEFSGSQVRLRIPCEAVITAPGTSVLEWLTAYLELEPRLTRRKMIAELSKVLGSENEAAVYMDRLVELGVVVQKIPIAEDPSSGAEALCRFLEDIPSEIAKKIRAGLLELLWLADEFAVAEHGTRLRMVAQIEKTAADVCALLHEEHVSSWSGRIIYEDCSGQTIANVTLPKPVQPALNSLERFITRYGLLLDDNAFHRRTISHILNKQLGGGPVPFLRFAQHWISALSGRFQSALTPVSSQALNPLNLTDLQELIALRREFGSLLAQSSPQKDIDIGEVGERKGWEQRIRQLEPGFEHPNQYWFACYCQPLANSSRTVGLVINNVFAGPCRLLMHLMSALTAVEERLLVASELRRRFEQACFPFEPCQLLASLDYNANLVARITDRVINYADDFTIEADRQIGLGDLEVVSQNGNAVLLQRSSQKRLIPLDCGMMASSLQPPIYRLLVVLGGIPDPPIRFFEPHLWAGENPEPVDEVRMFPRLSYGSCVLRRRGWSVPVDALPRRGRGESDFQYFREVRRWQRDLGLPDEVFVRTTSILEWRDQVQQTRDRQTWNRRKPQYIDFRNPFLTDVLEKTVQETRRQLYVEEMLPEHESWKTWGLQRAIEMVFDVLPNRAERFGVQDAGQKAI